MRRLSRALVLALVTVVGALFAGGCKPSGYLAPIEQLEPPPDIRLHHHTVSRGDTLYSIAWRYGMDYRQLAQMNGIGSPYTIYVGQKIDLGTGGSASGTGRLVEVSPGVAVGAAVDTSSGVVEVGGEPAVVPVTIRPEAPTIPHTPAPEPVVSAPAPVEPAAATLPPAAPAAAGRWQWPATGKLITTFAAGDPLRKGIDLEGKLGDPVRASAAGSVVYAGSALAGYGQLVIIKHDERFLSAYGHNSKLLVQEGDAVTAGQVIAEIGATGTDRDKLHFEIRDAGKPVDPLRYLPKR